MTNNRENIEKNYLPQKIYVELNEGFIDFDHELVYVASEEDEQINSFFMDNVKNNKVWSSLFGMKVIYLPYISADFNEDVFKYRAPYLAETKQSTPFGNNFFLNSFTSKSRQQVKQGLLWLKISTKNWERVDAFDPPYLYEFFPLSSDIDLSVQLFRICDYVRKGRIMGYSCTFEEEQRRNIEDIADINFNSQQEHEDIQDLMDEIREKVKRLRQRGIAEYILEKLIHPEERISKLIITKDYRLFLPEYQNMEIKMEPLVKAVYLLFLNHPEGIMFKELPDHRKELTRIYLKLKPNGLTNKVRKSIEDVTNPFNNSINEKCARIREAFVGQFDNHLARHYYIDGERAKPKKIELSPELVVWEK